MSLRHVIGVDLGPPSETTAIVIVEGKIWPEIPPDPLARRAWTSWQVIYGLPKREPLTESPALHVSVRHAERIGPGVSYPHIVQKVGDLMRSLTDPILAIDATAVGCSVVELFEKEKPRPEVITVTGGNTVSYDGDYALVPKKDLISAAQVFLQTGKLKIAQEIPLAESLLRELQGFRMGNDLNTGPDAVVPWREGPHDDLVLALAVALWVGKENIHVPVHVPDRFYGSTRAAEYWRRRRHGR